MSPKDHEFGAGNLVYEIPDEIIYRQGMETDIKFLGACPAEKITQICEEQIRIGKSFGETRTSKDSSGKKIYELLFYEEISLGKLEKDIKKGDCIIGKPSERQYTIWVSPRITFIK